MVVDQSEQRHDDVPSTSQFSESTRSESNATTRDASFSMPEKKRSKMTPTVIVLIVILVVCLVGGVAGGLYLANTYSQIRDVENAKAIEPTLPENVSDSTMKSPIDFKALQSQNPDIYAWIYIPGTDVNYPVCQNPEDGTFYLTHDASKKESQPGAIFTEAAFNNKDFQDPVTILYGHNGFGNTMFTSLHDYESGEYFDAHDKFYIYTPDHVYTYKVISAFMSDGNHLMGMFNFQNPAGFAQFVNYIESPNVVGAITRPGNVQADSKIVVLSTCNSGGLESIGRYLVSGVMVNAQSVE